MFYDLSHSSWWDTNWKKRILFNVTSPLAYAVTNVTLNITVSNSVIDYDFVQANCEDFRVLNASGAPTVQGARYELRGCKLGSGKDTYIYFNVDSFLSGINTFQLYWNNSGASAVSDMESAYWYGDTLDSSTGWTLSGGGGVSISNGVLNFTVNQDNDNAYKNLSASIGGISGNLDNITIEIEFMQTRLFGSPCSGELYAGLAEGTSQSDKIGISDCHDTNNARVYLADVQEGVTTITLLGSETTGTFFRNLSYSIFINKTRTSMSARLFNSSNGSIGFASQTITEKSDVHYFNIDEEPAGDWVGGHHLAILSIRVARPVYGYSYTFGTTESLKTTIISPNEDVYTDKDTSSGACLNDVIGNIIFMKFNLTSVQSNAQIQSAYLILNSTSIAGDGAVLRAYNCTGEWTESSSFGAISGLACSVTGNRTNVISTGLYYWDVTNAIKIAFESGAKNVTIKLNSTRFGNSDMIRDSSILRAGISPSAMLVDAHSREAGSSTPVLNITYFG